MLSVRLSAGTKPAKSLSVRDATGTLQTAKRGMVRTAAGLKTFYQAFTAAAVTLSPTSVSGAVNSNSDTTVFTASVTVTFAGAVGAVTYSWARTDAPLGTWSITKPAGAATSFSTIVSPDEHLHATFACTVTDTTGRSVTSPNVSANCSNLYHPLA